MVPSTSGLLPSLQALTALRCGYAPAYGTVDQMQIEPGSAQGQKPHKCIIDPGRGPQWARGATGQNFAATTIDMEAVRGVEATRELLKWNRFGRTRQPVGIFRQRLWVAGELETVAAFGRKWGSIVSVSCEVGGYLI